MWKKLYELISGAGTLWGLLPGTVTASITATLWVAVMAVAGYLQDVPIFWIMMGLPVAGAAIFTGLLRFGDWRVRNTAAGKLTFGGIHLGIDFQRDGRGIPVAIEKAQIRLVLTSIADFPISFVVNEFQTSFQGNYPPNKPRDDDGGTVANRYEIRAFSDNLIDMRNAPIANRINGTANFKIKYGHPGRLIYPLEKKITFEAAYDPNARTYAMAGHKEIE